MKPVRFAPDCFIKTVQVRGNAQRQECVVVDGQGQELVIPVPVLGFLYGAVQRGAAEVIARSTPSASQAGAGH